MASLDFAHNVLAITVGADGTHNIQLLLRHLPPSIARLMSGLANQGRDP